MAAEHEFSKYRVRGAYHWTEISRSIRRYNAYVAGRYWLVLDRLGDVKGKRVLDLGCGDGVLSYLLTRRGARVVGVDYSFLALRFGQEQFARRGLAFDCVEASAYYLPFPNDSFDCVVSSDVIEHLDNPTQMVAEAHRVLMDGGKFVLTTPYRLTEIPWDGEHRHEFFPQELADLLQQKFSVVHVRTSHPAYLLELYTLKIFSRPLFRYLLNVPALLGSNPFLWPGKYRIWSLIVAECRKH
jgi:SAM-dependent methyltransferase